MIKPAPSFPRPAPAHGSRNGMALVLVLACLVFVCVIVVAFLASMRSAVVSSRSGFDANGVKMLAETNVNLAISQVQSATKEAGEKGWAWASQPGMIRLYDSNGGAAGFRKLYSGDNMVGTAAFDPFATTEVIPATWSDDPAIYTDLNAPVTSGSAKVYPILDPAAIDTDTVEGAVSPAGAVDQFTLDNAPVAATANANTAPMPVKWLYVLEDGSVHLPTGSGTRAVVSAATKANKIVGRIAFWTDDETCKVNINTASEGTFWATPRFDTDTERDLGLYQPVNGEYQRYPGHPAMVSLSALFPNLAAHPGQIFDIAPRLSYGGSKGGTVAVKDITAPIATDRDRLYPSVDELLFKPSVDASENRQLNTVASASSGLTRDQVKSAPFFLTAFSRAPELNLYGKPRVAIWPLSVNNNANYRTASDRLIAFCSTVGGPVSSTPAFKGLPFYFTREESLDPRHDISLKRNNELLNYLDSLTGTAIPGFGGSFQSKYTQVEKRQILTEIFDYIRCTNPFDTTLTGGPPTAPYPYVYAQSSTNPGKRDGVGLETVIPANHAIWGTGGFGGHFLQVVEASIQFVGVGAGASSAPAADAVPIPKEQVGDRVGMDGNIPPSDTVAVQAYLLLSFLVPGEGTVQWLPGTWVEMDIDDPDPDHPPFSIKLKPSDVDYTPLGFPANGKTLVSVGWFGLNAGGVGGRVNAVDFRAFVKGLDGGKVLNQDSSTTANARFPFYSRILPVSTSSPTMDFKGGTITIKLYGDSVGPLAGKAPGKLAQTLTLTFPDASGSLAFPTPKLATMRQIGTPDQQRPEGDPLPPVDPATQDRWDINAGANSRLIDPDCDVVRSLVLASGDVRLLAKPNPPASLFQAHPDYWDSSNRMAHGLVYGSTGSFGAPGKSGTRGKLVRDASYATSRIPYVSAFVVNGAFTSNGAFGDWDNGTSVVPDGPFVNAPDEGSVNPLATSTPYFDNTNTPPGPAFFSPNRQVSSPVMFGSLPTGVQRGLPWQTLLFRPGPPGHPGLGIPADGPPYSAPPDHLLLDLFWMPTVEPYAISEPLSTAGKVNLNQQIVPFTYINRMSALRAALAAEKVAIMPLSSAKSYKSDATKNGVSRLPLNLSPVDGTLRQFSERFAKGEIFRSASEICDIYLVPQGSAWTSDATAQNGWYGNDFALVGDNTRERPYSDLYGRLTTKSNTYTVYYRAQTLRKPVRRLDADPTLFDSAEGDEVLADQRGQTTFERYIDPADPRFVDNDPAAAGASSLEEDYRVRILNAQVFSP